MPDRRYLSIWFCHLMTDWFTRLKPAAKDAPFVFAVKQKNRDIVTFASAGAAALGIAPGMLLSDAKIQMPALDVIHADPDPAQLLHRIALRFIRYSPEVATDPPTASSSTSPVAPTSGAAKTSTTKTSPNASAPAATTSAPPSPTPPAPPGPSPGTSNNPSSFPPATINAS